MYNGNFVFLGSLMNVFNLFGKEISKIKVSFENVIVNLRWV